MSEDFRWPPLSEDFRWPPIQMYEIIATTFLEKSYCNK